MMYADCTAIFDRAMASPKGIRIRCATHPAAVTLSRRLNTARVIDRRNSVKIYEPGHPNFNVSVWDHLIVTIPAPDHLIPSCGDPAIDRQRYKDAQIFVEVKPRTIENLKIEEIE